PLETLMLFRPAFRIVLFAGSLAGASTAQDAPMPQLSPGTARKTPAAAQSIAPAVPQSVALAVPKGTPLQVAVDQEVQLKKVGQLIHGRIVEPLYAFDHIVIPVGSEVTGHVTRIEGISRGKRTLAALDADFTPARKIEIPFDQLLLADGRHLPLETTVTPGSGQVIQFIAAA